MYISVADADAYFEKKYNSQLWVGSNSTAKSKALSEASLLLDNFNYVGTKTQDSQEHEFPRDSDTEIPEKMQWACAEIAYSIIDGFNVDESIAQLSITSQGFSAARVTYTRDNVPEHLRYGIPSVLAWGYMRPYLQPVDMIKINKV